MIPAAERDCPAKRPYRPVSLEDTIGLPAIESTTGSVSKEYTVKKILVAVDDCASTTIASPIIERTMELATAFASTVWIVHVVPDTDRPAPFNVDRRQLRREIATELSSEHDFLQRLAQCLKGRGIDTRAHLLEGATIRKLLEEAERLDINLIILGCHQHGTWLGALTEFAAEGLLSKCPRPIMFIPMPG